MAPLNPENGGTAGKGPAEIVVYRASWGVVFYDGLMQLALATLPPRSCHPTQAWVTEGIGSGVTERAAR